MKTYKFLELIELKKAGRKFKFSRGICSIHSDRLTEHSNWSVDQILDDWAVEFEPEVVECVMIAPPCGDLFASNGENIGKKLQGKRWKACFTEIVEGDT